MNKLCCKIIFLTVFIFQYFIINAQEKPVIDEVIAIIGSQVILKSDIERQVAEMKLTDSASVTAGRCEIFKNMVFQKLLVNQAYLDSLKVTDEQINSEISRRLDYFISQAGSVQNLEKYYNKSVTEIKDEMHDPIKEVILVRLMKDKIIGKQQISPRDINNFFNKLPADSLPFYNTEVEVAEIAVFAKPTNTEDQRAKAKITELRNRIIKGENFENLAILYSEDEGSATKGGDLGMKSSSDFVPEFAYAAMKLKKDSISEIIKTKFGYHIIKMVERKGEQFQVKHILVRPQITSESRNAAVELLTRIRKKILADSITFSDAAFKYSDDETTKNSGGMITQSENGSSKLPLDKLDATLFFLIDSMKTGQICPPVRYIAQDGRTGFRIVLLKSKTLPHKANLTDDYSKMQELATNYQNIELLEKWLKKTILNNYIQIKEPYNKCENVQSYLQSNKPK